VDLPTTLLLSGDVNALTLAAARNNEKQETFMLEILDCYEIKCAQHMHGREGMSWCCIITEIGGLLIDDVF